MNAEETLHTLTDEELEQVVDGLKNLDKPRTDRESIILAMAEELKMLRGTLSRVDQVLDRMEKGQYGNGEIIRAEHMGSMASNLRAEISQKRKDFKT